MSPVDECLPERCAEAGCSNQLLTSSQPLVVNTNGTSMIGVTAYVVAECQCAAKEFDIGSKAECRPGVCLNGGRCKEKEGTLSCLCPSGFDGPRCQQTRHSFRGNGWAWYKPLAQCEDSHTSIEIMTTRDSGVILYNGPVRSGPPMAPGDQVSMPSNLSYTTDFLLLELVGGYPLLRIDQGSGEVVLEITGQNSQHKRILQPLDDGRWHRIDIFKTGTRVTMTVDKCHTAIIHEDEASQTSSEDRRPCEVSDSTPGPNKFINVNTPLQLGGVANPNVNYPSRILAQGFNGCIRNLRHNGELYDLHIGKVGQHKNSDDSCLAEDQRCGVNSFNGPKCAPNGVCIANMASDAIECRCKPGWRGHYCTMPTTTKDFMEGSYLEWDFQKDFYTRHVLRRLHLTDLQMNFRTRQSRGMLFNIQNIHNSEFIILEIVDHRLQLRYNLGVGEHTVALTHVNISDGQWHQLTVERVGQWTELWIDGGEGQYYNMTLGITDGHRHFKPSQRSFTTGGDVRFSASQSDVLIDEDYKDSCISDIRYNGYWLPMDQSQNMESEAAVVTRSANLRDGCETNACMSVRCLLPLTCLDLWRHAECRCPRGQQFAADGKTCESIDECIANPCIHGKCIDTATGFYCECHGGYRGDYCNAAPSETSSADISLGFIVAIVICTLVFIILILLFIVYKRRAKQDSYKAGVDPNDDVRENIIHYNEEGMGEEDQDCYDINRLRKPLEDPSLRKNVPPDVVSPALSKMPRYNPNKPPNLGIYISDRLKRADDDPLAPPHDSVREYAYEGNGSDAGSISSFGSGSDAGDQNFDYLNNYGPRFSRLADMYRQAPPTV